MIYKSPDPVWYVGEPIIMAAFHYIPDLEDYPIYYWSIYFEAAKKILENKL